MKMKNVYLVLSYAVLLFIVSMCKQGSEKNAGQPGDSASGPPKYHRFEDCPRGVPEPILSQEVFTKRKFRIEEEEGRAYEMVLMPGSDSLVIVHGGCEYIETSFRFYTNEPANAAAKLMMNKKALTALNEIIQGLKDPKDFMDGTRILSDQLRKGSLKIGEEYEFGVFEPTGLGRTVMLKEVRSLPNGRLRVVVDFKTGPI